MMKLRVQKDCSDIDWKLVPEILKMVGMGYHDVSVHRKAFENSAVVVFVFDEHKLTGFGRAISDGMYQAAVYDVAVLPDYQFKGIGTLIMKNILNSLPSCNFILYASPGKERFYEKLKFRRMKTGMALFINADSMTEKGITE